MATSQPPLASSLPCLVFHHGAERHTTLYSVSDGSTHRPGDDIGELLRGKKQSWVTSHGWVLVWDQATLATYLWASGKNKIELPSLAEPPVQAGCVLSAEPTGPGGCTVLLTDRSTNLLWYCRAGGDPAASGFEWVRHEYDVGSIRVPADYAGPTKRKIYRPASWRGKFYYQRPGNEIGVLDFSTAGPAFSVLPIKGVRLVPVGDYMAAASPYLLDLDGELYMTYIFFSNIDFHTVKDVGVYRVDFERKEAVRVDGIGDRAILVGSSCAFAGWCRATKFGLLPNSVYWMSPYDGCLHVYDLETRTEETRETCGGAAEPSPTSYWMIPTHL